MPRPPGREWAAVLVALALAACGGGGGSGGGTPSGGAPEPGGDDLIIGTPGGREASAVETDDLRRNAASAAARGIGVNLGNLRRFDLVADADGPDGPGANDGLLERLESGSESLSARLLGVGDPGATVVRDGDVITVDPDDAALCAVDDTDPLAPGEETSSDCRELVAELTVQLDARSEDSGVIRYLFGGTPVAAIGYSPAGGGAELYLAGLQSLLERVATSEPADPFALDEPRDDVAIPTLSGTLRLDGRVLDAQAGAEAAEIELRVTETLVFGDADGSGLTLAPSRVFLLGTDAATGEARLSVAWGALRLIAESGDSDGDVSSTTLDLGGLTLDLAATDGSPTLALGNVGIGDTPLNVQVGGTDALTLALETFGVTLDTANGALVFDTPLGIDLMLDNLTGLIEERASVYTARFLAEAPAGTGLRERGEGVLQVLDGGPLKVFFVDSDDTGSRQLEVDAGAGACIGSDDTDDSSDDTDGSAVMDEQDDPLADLELATVVCP